MRFTRLQWILAALIIVCFCVCMILGIAIVSDINTVRRMFGQVPFYTESEKLHELSFNQKLNKHVMNSPHIGLSERSSSYTNGSMIMVSTERTGFVSKSVAVQVNVSEDILPNYDVHIFYYPWYGNPTYDGVYLHWNHPLLPHWKPDISARYPIGRRHQPPDDLGSSFYPRLGPYSSHDPFVIKDHMVQIRQSGAGYFTITWVKLYVI